MYSELNSIDDSDPNVAPRSGSPIVLLLGSIDHEGIVSSLKTSGTIYRKKLLESSEANWATIVDLFDQFQVRAVLVKLTGQTYEYVADRDYRPVRKDLVSCIKALPHMVFVYEDLLTGSGTPDEIFFRPERQLLRDVNECLASSGLNVIPYRTNAEATVLGQQLVADAEEGLLFRIYVPTGQLWSGETDRLLQLFRDYLTRVAHLKVRLEEVRTSRGTVYEFHGQDGGEEQSFSAELQDFSTLMELAISDPAAAEDVLRERQIQPREVIDILTRYSKEVRRIQTDMRHERERKLLSIKHRLESELVDVLPKEKTDQLLLALASSAVPDIGSGVVSSGLMRPPSLQISAGANSEVTVNVGKEVINAARAIIADEVSGTPYLTQEDHRMLTAIREHGGSNIAELTSAVHELSDDGIPQTRRTMARQRLKGFVIGIASKLGDTGSGVLLAYLESKLGL